MRVTRCGGMARDGIGTHGIPPGPLCRGRAISTVHLDLGSMLLFMRMVSTGIMAIRVITDSTDTIRDFERLLGRRSDRDLLADSMAAAVSAGDAKPFRQGPGAKSRGLEMRGSGIGGRGSVIGGADARSFGGTNPFRGDCPRSGQRP